jgi:hypothetical protein
MVVELQGHKFAATDSGAPMLCSLLCSMQGRHTHINFCHAGSAIQCTHPDVCHIMTEIQPNPGQAKDWVTHKLHWQCLGMYILSFTVCMLTRHHQFQRCLKVGFHQSSLIDGNCFLQIPIHRLSRWILPSG